MRELFPTSYGSTMRHRNVRESDGSMFNNDDMGNTYNTSKTKKTKDAIWRRMCSAVWCIVFVLVMLAIGMGMFFYQSIKESKDNNIRVIGGSVIAATRMSVGMASYESGLRNSKRRTWESYSTWNRCIKINRFSYDTDGNSTVMITEQLKVSDITFEELVISEAEVLATQILVATVTKGDNSTFVVPTMYMGKREGSMLMNDKNVFPCVCSVHMVPGELGFEGKILHMINPEIDSAKNLGFQSAYISIDVIEEFNSPLWMDIPESINVTYWKRQDGGVETVFKSLVIRDPINIVNAINCLSLMNVKRYPGWRMEEGDQEQVS